MYQSSGSNCLDQYCEENKHIFIILLSTIYKYVNMHSLCLFSNWNFSVQKPQSFTITIENNLEFGVCKRCSINNEQWTMRESFFKYFVTTILIFNIIPIGHCQDSLCGNILNKIQMLLKMLILLTFFEALPHVGTAQSRDAGHKEVT